MSDPIFYIDSIDWGPGGNNLSPPPPDQTGLILLQAAELRQTVDPPIAAGLR